MVWPIVGLLVLMLTACSPELNWREVRNTAEGYQVMFPDKPAAMQRTIQLSEKKVDMTMSGAKAAELTFTVGTVAADQVDTPLRQAMLLAMREQMVRNIQGKVSLQKDVNVPIIDPQARQVGLAPAQLVYVEGRHPAGASVQMRAVFGIHGTSLVQAVVMGPTISDEAAQVFFESLRWTVASK